DAGDDLPRRLEVSGELADRRAEERAALDDGGAGVPAPVQFLQVDDVVVVLRPQLEDPGRFFGAGEFFLEEHRQFAAADAGAAALEDLDVVATDPTGGRAPTFLRLSGECDGGEEEGATKGEKA